MSSSFVPPVPASRDEALRALGTTDAELRRLVVRALERAPADTAREMLSIVLGDEDWRVRKEGIQLAHALAERADVVPVLVSALSAPTDQVALRNAAVEALAGLGAQSAPAVEEALLSGALDADGRKLAVDVLAGARQSRSVPVLVSALEDADSNVRAAAAEALGWIGGEVAVAALAALLPSGDRFLRLVALEGLNRVSAPIDFAQIAPFLGDRILRHGAVAALGRASGEGALGALVEALGDSSRHVGETALRVLGELLRDDPTRAAAAREHARALGQAARERVLAAAEGDEPVLRRAALPVLALLADATGPETDALVRALRDPDIAEDAEDALASLGDAVLPTLIEVAQRGDVHSRAAVLTVLPRVARDRVEAIDVLRDALRDPDREIVAAAAAAFAVALGAGAVPNAADVHALLRVASGKDAARGSTAAKAAAIALQSLRTLARVRPATVRPHLAHVDVADEEAPVVCALLAVAGSPEHIPWLERAATAPLERTRRAAVEALGQIGGGDAAVALGYAITDESPDVALAAIKALGRVRDESGLGVGVAALRRLIDAGGDEAIVSAAVRALGATADARAVEVLRPLCASPSVAIACAALEAEADLRAPDLREIARASLGHASSVVARTALDVLETMLDPYDTAFAADVAQALGHASWEVRRRAIEIVARLDPLVARPLLSSRASVESEPAVREALERATADLERRISRGDGRGDGRPSRPPPGSIPPRSGDG